MPTIVSPPDLERRPRRSFEEDDGGHGRRPPNGGDLKRTGGGGDNDNWDNRPNRPHHPGQRLISYRLGLFFALGAVFLFFTGLVSVFSVTQPAGRLDAYNHAINAWLPAAVPPILWLNTAVLLLSSVTVEIARRRIFHSIDAMEEWFGLGHPITRRALPWLLATLVLGSLFLAGQWLAWHQLALEGVSLPIQRRRRTLLLHPHLRPRHPSRRRHHRPHRRRRRSLRLPQRRRPPDPGRLRSLVLARHRRPLALPLHPDRHPLRSARRPIIYSAFTIGVEVNELSF